MGACAALLVERILTLAFVITGESLITGGAALQDLVDWLAQSPSLKQNGKDVGDEA